MLGPTFREQVQEWSVHQSEGYARWPQGWGMLSAHSPRCDWFELWVCGGGEGVQEKRRVVGWGWYDCKSWEEQRGTHRYVTDWTSLHQADAQLPILPKCCLLALPCADQVCIHTMFTRNAWTDSGRPIHPIPIILTYSVPPRTTTGEQRSRTN